MLKKKTTDRIVTFRSLHFFIKNHFCSGSVYLKEIIMVILQNTEQNVFNVEICCLL